MQPRTSHLGKRPTVKEAARAVGMPPAPQLRRVALPLAMPVIVAGIRTAPVWTVGIATLKQRYGADTNWVQTSYNRNMRTHYASIGGTYHPERDVFLYAQPFPSGVLTDDHNWEAPVPYPDDGPNYYWDEDSGSWIEIEMPEE